MLFCCQLPILLLLLLTKLDWTVATATVAVSVVDFLGRTEVRVKDILAETRKLKGPITKRLPLHEVETGEVVVKLNLQLFDSS